MDHVALYNQYKCCMANGRLRFFQLITHPYKTGYAWQQVKDEDVEFFINKDGCLTEDFPMSALEDEE